MCEYFICISLKANNFNTEVIKLYSCLLRCIECLHINKYIIKTDINDGSDSKQTDSELILSCD